jgi:hypothetical protein
VEATGEFFTAMSLAHDGICFYRSFETGVYTCNLRVTSDALLRKDSQHPLWGLGLFFGLIAVFVAICHWKGAPQG